MFWENLPFSTVIVSFSHKMSKSIFFSLVDVHIHTWIQKIDELKKIEKKMVVVFPFFSTSRPKEWQCFEKIYPPLVVIVPFPHKMSKLIFLVPINIHTHNEFFQLMKLKKKGTLATKNKTKELDYGLTNY
jgi:hypothetical protein